MPSSGSEHENLRVDGAQVASGVGGELQNGVPAGTVA
jgi:hypothetical protein